MDGDRYLSRSGMDALQVRARRAGTRPADVADPLDVSSANGHGGRAAASLTFRALAVGLTIEAAARLAHCPAEETSVCNPIGSQLVVGILAIPFIAIFDDALARDKVQQPPPAGVSFAPGFFATREGVFGSLAGTFCGL